MTSRGLDPTQPLEPVFFWRDYEEPYGFLSEWYHCTFEVDGVAYHSIEMWMMVQKAKLFGDDVCIKIVHQHGHAGVVQLAAKLS